MGGNALKEIETRRVNRAEYDQIKNIVLSKLAQRITGARINDILAYRTKESFGDLDVLVETFPGDSHNSRIG
jgi:hypothetical protein